MNFTIFATERTGFLFDVGSLYARLNHLGDKRKAKGKRYSLGLVLLLLLLAKLAGEDKPSGIAEWAQHRCQKLAAMLQLERVTMPCHNTTGASYKRPSMCKRWSRQSATFSYSR